MDLTKLNTFRGWKIRETLLDDCAFALKEFSVSVDKDVPSISVVGRTFEPHRKKTCLRDFRPGPTQTGLYTLEQTQKMTRDLKFKI